MENPRKSHPFYNLAGDIVNWLVNFTLNLKIILTVKQLETAPPSVCNEKYFGQKLSASKTTLGFKISDS
jgi:hypothetical protein